MRRTPSHEHGLEHLGQLLRVQAVEPDEAVHVLLALLEPRHGYAVMQFLEQQSNGAITLGPASLYTTLKKLDRAGFIEEADTDSGSRRIYRITAVGHEVLIQSIDRRRQLLTIADQIMEEARA